MTVEVERAVAVRDPDAVAASPVVTRRRNRERLHALDGLRGVAAFLVVLHHVLLIAQPVSQPPGEPAVLSGWWWLERTPLKLLTAGHEAVIVFFVLSGVVVVLPALRRVDFSWPGLVVSRVVRLMLPAWAAIVFATALLLLVPRVPQQVTGGSWLAGQVQSDWSWQRLVVEFSLMGNSVPYNNVLWTLKWEFLFSLLLPGFLVVAVLLHRWWLPTGLLAVGLGVAGTVGGIEALEYLPVFFLGTLIAVRLRAIEGWSESRRAKRLLAVILPASLLLLVIEFLLAPVVPEGSDGSHALIGLEALGGAGVVVVAGAATGFRRFLEGRVPQFLGRISFSLYLVHLPVLATITWIVGDWNWPIAAAVGIPLAVLTGWGFFRVVEKPLHKVARSAKRGASRAVERYVRSDRTV
ncbi:acyltransferase family protein [Amnibacterium kyonggiense]|uniref:Peptidoglycan/LPS O-acetylase OafA/YrhL n=1 Tax=Amnibacterium kyonggiense TaxID=595671 RepID=A0A4R7FD34_9MICO|nr:acyltransferase [Amnibacterium kyonggiense]TDS74849.1 peptidoglycan/LPS O-acetylase OafA/YrhL [Amnibacterium kyonggiense]